MPETSLLYGYLTRINRVFGDAHPQGNWNSDSHLVHASRQLCPATRLTGYKFWSHLNGRDYGQEVDLLLSRKFGRHFTTLAKYAWYEGGSGRPDLQRFWLQAEFNY